MRLARFAPSEPALAAVGGAVHDIDCHDERFDRPETQGIARRLRGLKESCAKEAECLERGAAPFEDRCVSFRGRGAWGSVPAHRPPAGGGRTARYASTPEGRTTTVCRRPSSTRGTAAPGTGRPSTSITTCPPRMRPACSTVMA
jgi:hypothetical protein